MSMFGRSPHPQSGQDLLPANTALAMFGDLDATQVWQVLERELTQSGIPQAMEIARAWPEMFEKQTQIPWAKLLASLGGELGLVLTLDEAQKVSLPGPGGPGRRHAIAHPRPPGRRESEQRLALRPPQRPVEKESAGGHDRRGESKDVFHAGAAAHSAPGANRRGEQRRLLLLRFFPRPRAHACRTSAKANNRD